MYPGTGVIHLLITGREQPCPEDVGFLLMKEFIVLRKNAGNRRWSDVDIEIAHELVYL